MTANDVIQAITEAIEARSAESRAREAYSGYSWGYVGSRLIQEAADAESRAERCLDAYIAERIAKALKEAT